MANKLLLVDDEPSVIQSLRRALLDEPFEIYTAGSADEALELVGKHQFKVVVSDERMPGMGGAEFLSLVRNREPRAIRIMLSGQASLESVLRAINTGEVYRYLTKPWKDSELILTLRSAISLYDVEQENRHLLCIVRAQKRELETLRRTKVASEVTPQEQVRYQVEELSEKEREALLNEYGVPFSAKGKR